MSHDRTFLDRTAARILELDEATHTITEYACTYTEYVAKKERELGKQRADWKDQQVEVRRVEEDIRRTKERALRTERSTTHDFYRGKAKKVARKAKAKERRLNRLLESQDRVEKPKPAWRMKLEFGEMPRGGQIVCSLDKLGHHFGNQWLFHDVNLVLEHGERVALLGPNGSGKTTLLRAIAGELRSAEGSVRIGANVRLGYMPQGQESLESGATPLSVIRQASSMSETEARHFLHFFLFEGEDAFARVENLSYGERARLILGKLVLIGANFLLLDEPLNHLDIPSRERFQAALESFPGTVLVAAHDRTFIDQVATGIWSFESGTVRRYIDRHSLAKAQGSW